MSDPFATPIRDRAIAYIRTYVPIAVGAILSWLIANVAPVADFIATIDRTFGQGWRTALVLAASATVTALYYWGARQIGKRFPKAEKWLLGSSAVPTYTAKQPGEHVLLAGE